MTRSTRSAAAEFLGLKRDLVLLLVALLVMGMGEELWMRFLPKYLDTLGATALVIGLFDGLKTFLGAAYAYPGGVLADRLGLRRALVRFTALSIAGYALVLLIPHWEAVIGGTFFFLAWSDLSLPATFALVKASLAAEKHAMGIGTQSLVKRVPVMVGPLLGGMLLDRYGVRHGIRIGVAISIALGGVALAVQGRVAESAARAATHPDGILRVLGGFDPRLRRLLFSDILIRFCERIPYAWVVIYVMDALGMSATQVGTLIAVEMAAAMVCYIPASHFAGRYGREPFVIATFVFFTLFPLLMLPARNFSFLLAAFAVRGLKEFGEPARKALIIEYSQQDGPGTTIGAYYLVRDVVVTAGSFFGAALWKLGPAANFACAGVLGAAGTLAYAATLARKPARPSES